MNHETSPSPPPLEDAAFYAAMLDSLPLGVYRIDRDGRITYANQLLCEMLGIDTATAVGQVIYDFFPEHVAIGQRKDDQWILSTGQPINKTPGTGDRQYRREMKSVLRDATGSIVGIQGILWDASELMQAHADLKESEERFNLFMDTLPAAVFIKNDESTTLYCNRYMLDIIGAKKWLGKDVHDFFPPEVAEKMIADDQRCLEAGHVVTEEQVPGADGRVRTYQTYKFSIPRQGMRSLLGGIAIDITERKSAELELQTLNARLKVLAAIDQLTGLANRRYLTEQLEHEVDRMSRYGGTFSVILLDIDHFKSINDNYGHQSGDSVITQLGSLLAAGVRTVDTPGRWGGEEFLIICPGTDLAGVANLAEHMRQRIEQHDFGIALPVTASFGVATSRPDLTVDALVKLADDALYQAKAMSRNRVVSAPA